MSSEAPFTAEQTQTQDLGGVPGSEGGGRRPHWPAGLPRSLLSTWQVLAEMGGVLWGDRP